MARQQRRLEEDVEAARARAKEAAEQLAGREREGRVLRERMEGLQFEAGMCEGRTVGALAGMGSIKSFPCVSCGAGEARKAVWAKQLELRGCAEELHVVTQESQAQQVMMVIGRLFG